MTQTTAPRQATSESPARAEGEPQVTKRNFAPFVLAGAVVLLVVYYLILGASGILQGSTNVNVTGDQPPSSPDYLTLQVRTQDVDLSNRALAATIFPVPHGSYVGAKTGEISKGLRIEITSGGATTTVVTYPGAAIVDPTALNLQLDRGDSSYPLDRLSANMQFQVKDDKTGDSVPFVVNLDNAARPWVLSAAFDPNNPDTLALEGTRDPLSIALAFFSVIAILVTTLIGVVTIGSAVLNKTLAFSNVIWLSATMLSFPALRAAMPGAPPIGTALDFLVTFPCTVLIAIMLVTTGAYLLWKESWVLRRFRVEDGRKTEENPASVDDYD